MTHPNVVPHREAVLRLYLIFKHGHQRDPPSSLFTTDGHGPMKRMNPNGGETADEDDELGDTDSFRRRLFIRSTLLAAGLLLHLLPRFYLIYYPRDILFIFYLLFIPGQHFS